MCVGIERGFIYRLGQQAVCEFSVYVSITDLKIQNKMKSSRCREMLVKSQKKDRKKIIKICAFW